MLAQSRHPVVVVSLLEELIQRDCLVSALGGRCVPCCAVCACMHALMWSVYNRDEVALEPLLAFLVKYVPHPKYAPILIDVANATFGEMRLGSCARDAAFESHTFHNRPVRPCSGALRGNR